MADRDRGSRGWGSGCARHLIECINRLMIRIWLACNLFRRVPAHLRRAASMGHFDTLIIAYRHSVGTSFGAPTFAGILALINQKTGSAGQGNINYILYPLAAISPTAFHDITTGDNTSPCQVGTQDCPTAAQLASLPAPATIGDGARLDGRDEPCQRVVRHQRWRRVDPHA